MSTKTGSLSEVGCKKKVTLALPPLSPSIFEPYLKLGKRIIIASRRIYQKYIPKIFVHVKLAYSNSRLS